MNSIAFNRPEVLSAMSWFSTTQQATQEDFDAMFGCRTIISPRGTFLRIEFDDEKYFTWFLTRWTQ